MNRITKLSFIIATSLIVAGFVLFAVVMTALGWDFSKLNTVKYESNSHLSFEVINDISITTSTADISFVPTRDSYITVECYEMVNSNHSVSFDGGKLTIEEQDNRPWYEHIGINFGSPKITVYLPQRNLNVICAETDTGDICIENIKAISIDFEVHTGDISINNANCSDNLKIEVTTGDIELSNINCKNLLTSGSTGDVEIENLLASQMLSITRSTGDVEFSRCDAPEIIIQTDTGDVTGSLLSGKTFFTSTDTGRVRVPDNNGNGKCQINTNTGDIKISIRDN